MSSLASAFIKILPDTAGFKKMAQKEVDASLAAVSKTAKVKVTPVTDTHAAEGQAALAGKSYASRMGSALTSGLKVVGPIAALALVGGFAMSIKKAVDVPLAQLKVSLKNAGTSFKAMEGSIGGVQDKLEKFGFTNADVDQSIINLTRATGNARLALKMQTSVADLARAKHVSLADASMMLARASEGNARALKGLGVIMVTGATDSKAMSAAQTTLKEQISNAGGMAEFAKQHHLKLRDAQDLVTKASQGNIDAMNKLGITVLPKTATSADRMAQIQRVLNERLGGTAAKQATVFGGRLDVIKAQFTNIAAKIGLAVLPALSKFLGVISKLVSIKPVIIGIVGVLGLLTLAWVGVKVAALAAALAENAALLGIPLLIAGAVAAIVFAIKKWRTFGPAIVAAILPGIGIIIGLVMTIMAHWRGLLTFFKTLWHGIAAAGVAVWNGMKAAWNALAAAFKSIWNGVSASLRSAWNAVRTAWNAVWSALKVAWRAVVSAFKTIWNTASGSLRVVWNAIRTAWNAVWNAMKTAFRAVINAFRSAWNVFFGAMRGAWNGIRNAWNAVWGALKAAFRAVVNSFRGSWNWFFGLIRNAWNAIRAAWNVVWGALKAAWNRVCGAFKNAWSGVVAFFSKAVPHAFSWMWSAFSNTFISPLRRFFSGSFVNFFTNAVPNAFKWVWGVFYDNVVKPITDFFKGIWNKITDFFTGGDKKPVPPGAKDSKGHPFSTGGGVSGHSKGGGVSGPGTGTSDDILAWLSDGEYVIRAASVSKYGTGMLAAINAGQYATGGKITYLPTARNSEPSRVATALATTMSMFFNAYYGGKFASGGAVDKPVSAKTSAASNVKVASNGTDLITQGAQALRNLVVVMGSTATQAQRAVVGTRAFTVQVGTQLSSAAGNATQRVSQLGMASRAFSVVAQSTQRVVSGLAAVQRVYGTAVQSAQRTVTQFTAANRTFTTAGNAAQRAVTQSTTANRTFTTAGNAARRTVSGLSGDLRNNTNVVNTLRGRLMSLTNDGVNGSRKAVQAANQAVRTFSASTRDNTSAVDRQHSRMSSLTNNGVILLRKSVEAADASTDRFSGAMRTNQSVADSLRGRMNTLAHGGLDVVKSSLNTLIARFPAMKPAANAAAASVETMRSRINAAIKGVQGKTVTVGVSFSAGAIVSSVKAAVKSIQSISFSTGGPVDGPGSPTSDSIPARLSREEYVVQASAHRKYGTSAMDAVNKGKATIGYAGGGAVEAVKIKGSTPSVDSIVNKVSSGFERVIAPTAKAALELTAKVIASMFGGDGTAIARFAKSFVGKVPYVTGGRTPSGWDCSGFTQYVYKHFGYDAPGTSETQYTWAKKSKNYNVPGALVFMQGDGTYAPPGHVGISLGGGKMVNAAGTGLGTRIDTISGLFGQGFGIPPGGFRGGGSGRNATGDLRGWAIGVLNALGIKATSGAIAALVHWGQMEGGHYHNNNRFNVLNTMQTEPGSSGGPFPSYTSWASGIKAVVDTLNNGRYGGILAALRSGDYAAIGRAILGSPWGTTGWKYGGPVLNRYETGTSGAKRGLALVGEKGPELVSFFGGESVFNAKNTAAALAMGGIVGRYAKGTGGINHEIDDARKKIRDLAGKIRSFKTALSDKHLPAKTRKDLTARMHGAEYRKKVEEKHLAELEKHKAVLLKHRGTIQAHLSTLNRQIAADKRLLKGAPANERRDLNREIKKLQAEAKHSSAAIKSINRRIGGRAPKSEESTLATLGKELMSGKHSGVIKDQIAAVRAAINKVKAKIRDDSTLLKVKGISKSMKSKLTADLKRQKANLTKDQKKLTFYSDEQKELIAYRTQLANHNKKLEEQIAAAKRAGLKDLAARLLSQLNNHRQIVRDINKWLGDSGVKAAAKPKPTATDTSGDTGDTSGGDTGGEDLSGSGGSDSTSTQPPPVPVLNNLVQYGMFTAQELASAATSGFNGSAVYNLDADSVVLPPASTSGGSSTFSSLLSERLASLEVIKQWGDFGTLFGGKKIRVFDSGGWLPTGMSLAYNGTGKPERVTTNSDDESLIRHLQIQNQKLERIATILEHAPRRTASGISEVLNGVARSVRH